MSILSRPGSTQESFVPIPAIVNAVENLNSQTAANTFGLQHVQNVVQAQAAQTSAQLSHVLPPLEGREPRLGDF